MIPSHEDEAGNKLKGPDPYVWKYSSAIAVEVEMSPQKSRQQMVKNYSKNKMLYASISFVVTSDNKPRL